MTRPPSFFRPEPFESWPKLDRDAWDRALIDNDFGTDDGGLAFHWRRATREMATRGYGVWLSWLRGTGRMNEELGPADRASVENVRAYLADMRWAGYSEHSCSARLTMLGSALRVMCPSAATTFITRASGRIAARGPKGRDLSLPGRTAAELLELGSKLMREAETADDVATALMFRDGLMLSLLVHRPIRVSNFASIRNDRHLRRVDDGYILVFAAEEIKAHRSFQCSVPPSLTRLLDRYLDEVRPRLCKAGRGPASLWVSIHGENLAKGGVTGVIRSRTKAAFGKALGPHLVRHIVGTTIAEDSPQMVADAATVLGHRRLGISERHYIHASAMQAGVKFEAALLKRLLKS